MTRNAKILCQWVILIWAALIVCLLLLAVEAHGQEQYIRACQQQYACQLDSGRAWSSPTQTYVFTPYSPNESVRIFLHNNNTTSAHTAQTLTLWITQSTTANVSLINNSDVWVQAAIIDNSVAGAKCLSVNKNQSTAAAGANGTASCYSVGMYAAQMAIQLNPGGAAGGSPDTYDLSIVQQPSQYPGGPQPGADNSTGGSYEDPCTNLVNRQNVTLLNSSGSTAQFIAAVAGKQVFICSVSGTFVTGTAGTSLWQLSTGTGVNCGGSTASITGGAPSFSTTTATIIPISYFASGTLFTPTPAGNAVCSNETGTGAVLDLTVTFVQQ